MTRPRFLPVVVLSLAVVASACANAKDDTSPPSASTGVGRLVSVVPPPGGTQATSTFVTAVLPSKAYLAVVVDGADALVYVCDGDTLGQAMTGRVQDGRIEVADDRVRLVATLVGDAVTGQLTLPGGEPLAFRAPPAVEGETGLFRSTRTQNGVDHVSWWIRTDRGLKGTLTTSGGKAGLDAEVASTTASTGTSSGTTTFGRTGSGTTPLAERHDIIPGGSNMTCSQLANLADSNFAAMRAAKTKQVQELYRQAAQDAVSQALLNGC